MKKIVLSVELLISCGFGYEIVVDKRVGLTSKDTVLIKL